MTIQNQLKFGILLALVFFIFYSVYSIFFGHIAMEEAAYTYAAKLVREGKVPYTDFFYPQAPLLPYLYAAFQFAVGDSLILNRFISLFFSALTFFLIYKIAKNKNGLTASLIALSLFVSNVFTLTRYTAVLIYASTSFFIILSVFFATKKKTILNIFFSLLAMAAGVAIRISVLPAFIILAFYFFFKNKGGLRKIFVVAASAVTILIFFLPFIIADFDRFYFDIITYQINTTKYYTIFEDISAFRWNLGKTLLVSGLIENFFSAIITAGALIIYYFIILVNKRKHLKEFFKNYHFEILLILLILSLFAVHLAPNRPYTAYFTIIVPLCAVFFGISFSKILNQIQNKGVKKGLISFFIFIIIISPIMVSERTILNVNPFKTVAEASDFIKKNTPEGSKVLTLSVLPALSSNRELLPFTERGNYLYFPRLPKPIVKNYKLLDAETLISYINNKKASAIAADSRYFYQKRVSNAKEEFQAIKKALKNNYYEALIIEDYAGNWGKIYIYLPRD